MFRIARTKVPARIAATMVLAGSVALTGCGGSSSAGGLLNQVEKTHKLTIAMSAYAPEDFQNSSGGWTGYDPAILSAFAKTLGAKLVINPIPFASSVEAVETHRDDLTIDIYYTAQRAKAIAYSRPMLNYTDAVAVNASHPKVTSATVSGLSGKNTAVVIGSEEVGEAKKIPSAHVTQYDQISDSFLALSSGKVDDDLQPDVDISWAKKKNPSLNIKILGSVPASIAPPIATLRGYYGVPKGSYGASFLAKLNAYLKKIACNGSEAKMLAPFGMGSPVYLQGICKASNAYGG